MAGPLNVLKSTLHSALHHQASLPMLVVAVGVMVTFLVYQALENRETELVRMRFQSLAEEHVTTIENRVPDAFEVIHLMAQFHQGPEDANWRRFRTYARSLIDRRESLRMLVWAPLVTAAERPAFEASVSERADQPFEITEQATAEQVVPAREREAHFPIYYLVPYHVHESLWGADLAAQPEAFEAIAAAEDTEELVATAPIIMLSKEQSMRSIWVFKAIRTQARTAQNNGATDASDASAALDDPTDQAESRATEESEDAGASTFQGVVAGVFRPRMMLDSIVPRFSRDDILLKIRDAQAVAPYDLIYQSQPDMDATETRAEAAGESDDEAAGEASWRLPALAERTQEALPTMDDRQLAQQAAEGIDAFTTQITVAGRTWRIDAWPTQGFVQQHHTWTPDFVLAGGLGATLLLGLYLSNVLTRTRRIEAEVTQRTAELRNMANALRRSNESLEEFAYIASHDLQEPLRKVRGFGEMLEAEAGDVLSPQQRDYLQRMQNAAQRMQELITGLLEYSRITTKSQPLESIDLTAIARQVVDDLELRIRETGGRVEIDELPSVEADPLQMRQLLQNLIGNALKFHRPDVPPVVRVRGEHIDAERCRIEVEDNGIGFESEKADRIFKPFQRLHGRGAYDGTGMGLAVCKKIVQRHGGSITAQSTPGRGATFRVILPCRHDYTRPGYGWPNTTTSAPAPQAGHHPHGG